MSRVRQDPLRALTKEERSVLIQIARSHGVRYYPRMTLFVVYYRVSTDKQGRSGLDA